MKLQNKGISLVQVLLMAAAISGVAVITTQLNTLTTKTSAKIRFSNDINMVVNDINGILSDPAVCRTIFPQTTSTTPPSIGKYFSGTEAAPPEGYGISRLVVDSFLMTPPTVFPGIGALQITIRNREVLKEPDTIKKKIHIYMEATGVTMTTCRSNLASTSSDIWSRLGSSPNVNYSSGNVGVGTNTPASMLDIIGEIKIGSTGALCDVAHPENEGMQRYNAAVDIMEYCVPSKGWSRFCPVAVGQALFTSSNIMGVFYWTCPAGVTSVSVVGIEAGKQGGATANGDTSYTFWGGKGGNLAYKNNIPVTPGLTYGIQPYHGILFLNSAPFTTLLSANGTVSGQVKYMGGSGSSLTCYSATPCGVASGGGAAGYAGNGGNANAYGIGASGSGGGGGGGGGDASSAISFGTSGGGVGVYGIGTSGAGGDKFIGGKGGSGGADGAPYPAAGGTFGGGGTLYPSPGAVRIIWPGTTREFPSTGTQDM